MTLDDLLEFAPPPGIIKMDIEGAEEVALGGAERILQEYGPELFLEVKRVDLERVWEFLRHYGYSEPIIVDEAWGLNCNVVFRRSESTKR